ncbi:hypothetical protein OE88DRAFT_1647584 [Heliocybe sulcata]|uniref:DRBM domain-containing protein n=1 Tax=Heliocybe sulcata TaxID=5364 RepID=A0A5C3MVN7_9AGAM|nr:hypothetical protein OE88DRAFT_1647584 [Heliocybe sulcata]
MVYPEGLGPDALTVLNDYLQRNATTSLLSWEMQQSGSDHAAYWTAIAMSEKDFPSINGVEYGRGGGMRAKDARNAAARQVISAIEKEPMTIRRRRGKSPESETDGLDQRWSYQSAVPSDSASQSRFAESTAERKDSRVPEADGNIAPESDASSVHQYPPHGSHCKGVGSNASAEPPVGSASVGQIQRDQDHLRSFGRDTEVAYNHPQPTDTFELKLHLKPQCHVSTVIDRSWHDEKLRLCLVSTYNEMRDPWRRWIFARKLR